MKPNKVYFGLSVFYIYSCVLPFDRPDSEDPVVLINYVN